MEYNGYLEKLEELKGDAPNRDRVDCTSCGDLFYEHVSVNLTHGKCPECYEEIHFGVIPKGTVEFIGEGPRFPDNDMSQGLHQNVIKGRENSPLELM